MQRIDEILAFKRFVNKYMRDVIKNRTNPSDKELQKIGNDFLNYIHTFKRFLDKTFPDSFTYHSSTIKKIIIAYYRNKCWVCDEISVGKSRFDVIAVEKYNEEPKVIGFEIKTSKSDLKNDTKFENYLKYCHKLFFVVPEDLKDDAVTKAKNSQYKKHIGVISIENNGNMLFAKRCIASKQKINIDIDNLTGRIIESAYYRYVFG